MLRALHSEHVEASSCVSLKNDTERGLLEEDQVGGSDPFHSQPNLHLSVIIRGSNPKSLRVFLHRHTPGNYNGIAGEVLNQIWVLNIHNALLLK